MKITLLTRSLDYGGSERQLVALARGLSDRGQVVRVVVFYPGGVLQKDLHDAGVPVFTPNKRSRWDLLGFMVRLARLLREDEPELLYSYLAVPNIIGALLKPFLREVRLVWGIRASNMDLSRYDLLSRLPYRMERRLARFADLIIANSHAGRAYAVRRGFPENNTVVIPNGIDLDYFFSDPISRDKTRTEWEVAEEERLVGLVGRFDPMKDHTTFLSAAEILARERPDVRFVCVGDGPEGSWRELRSLSDRFGLAGRTVWAGVRDDMPAVYSALDVACSSSSFGEGFSNVIGEAMACGVPCVVTDVGDSAEIVGDTGIVVPPGQPQALAEGLRAMLERLADEGDVLRESARERIKVNFSRAILVEETTNALLSLFMNSETQPLKNIGSQGDHV